MSGKTDEPVRRHLRGSVRRLLVQIAVVTDAPPRLRSVLICHNGALLDREGLSAWMASFSELAGIVELSETTGRTMQRLKAQVRRSGVWRLLDVFALRLYYRLAHAAGDRQFEQNTVK